MLCFALINNMLLNLLSFMCLDQSLVDYTKKETNLAKVACTKTASVTVRFHTEVQHYKV